MLQSLVAVGVVVPLFAKIAFTNNMFLFSVTVPLKISFSSVTAG